MPSDGARHGVAVPRGQDQQGADPPTGRFGRMFGCLQPCHVSDDAIEALVAALRHTPKHAGSANGTIPAGFTYLGQFIDHDVTFDPTPPTSHSDPHALVNFRTPRLDLDSVYGSGPIVQPYLYDWDTPARGARMLVGDRDLPRTTSGRAIVGDARNDENAIIAQLHLLFLRFHNAVVKHVRGRKRDADALRIKAQQIVRWHYQWIVTTEFLPMVLGDAMAKRVLGGRPKFFSWPDEPFIPVEFSAAAYRFGHSMVRPAYGLQRIHGDLKTTPLSNIVRDLHGFRPLASNHHIDWERFFELDDDLFSRQLQRSMAIDTEISDPLSELPDRGGSLPRRNLLRGRALGLPSGQGVAHVMHEPLLNATQLGLKRKDPNGRKIFDDDVAAELLKATPLWYYVLCEAASRGHGGNHLGPVGGRIVGEVLVGLLRADTHSYLNAKPAWEPHELGFGPEFNMAHLIRFVEASEKV